MTETETPAMGTAARLARDAAHRRTPGSPGPKARRAWRRLVRRAARGEPPAQDAVRELAALPPGQRGALSDDDVLQLLAAGPVSGAARAAYLTLIGQPAQRRALDPDGTLLALAYRAARAGVRKRLRVLLAAEGDGDTIRVVVTGERRDRLAELSYEELDYLGHQLAAHGDVRELRRLVTDLPLAKAAAVARLLPAAERAVGGDGAAQLPALLAAYAPERLRHVVERLPREHLIGHQVARSTVSVAFSPDSAELAVSYPSHRINPNAGYVLDSLQPAEVHVETLMLATGAGRYGYSGESELMWEHPVVHTGRDILLQSTASGHDLVRIRPDGHTRERLEQRVGPHGLWRCSTGAVLLCSTGLAFADGGGTGLRVRPVSLPADAPGPWDTLVDDTSAVATLPSAARVALYAGRRILLLNEQGELLHHTPQAGVGQPDVSRPALAFLSPTTVALHFYTPPPSEQFTDVWEFPPDGPARRTAHHTGPINERWPWEEWQRRFTQGLCVENAFAGRIFRSTPNPLWDIDEDTPWLQRWSGPNPPSLADTGLTFHALAPWGDAFVTGSMADPYGYHLLVHSPHLPTARTLLERPLAQHTPGDLQRVLRLRGQIGDPDVRDLLGLLGSCLAERFGGDISLGGETATAGATDIVIASQGKSTRDAPPAAPGEQKGR